MQENMVFVKTLDLSFKLYIADSYLDRTNTEIFNMFFLSQRNGTTPEGGEYTIHAQNDESFGNVLRWNGLERTSYFQGECGIVKGSTGAFFPIKPDRTEITFFDSDTCKPVILIYEKDVDVKGLPGIKFSGKYMFDNGKGIE